jgi:hypothetical protein
MSVRGPWLEDSQGPNLNCRFKFLNGAPTGRMCLCALPNASSSKNEVEVAGDRLLQFGRNEAIQPLATMPVVISNCYGY